MLVCLWLIPGKSLPPPQKAIQRSGLFPGSPVDFTYLWRTKLVLQREFEITAAKINCLQVKCKRSETEIETERQAHTTHARVPPNQQPTSIRWATLALKTWLHPCLTSTMLSNTSMGKGAKLLSYFLSFFLSIPSLSPLLSLSLSLSSLSDVLIPHQKQATLEASQYNRFRL